MGYLDNLSLAQLYCVSSKLKNFKILSIDDSDDEHYVEVFVVKCILGIMTMMMIMMMPGLQKQK